MTKTVERIVDEIKALPESKLEELLAWLAEFAADRQDSWDQATAADSAPGGRLGGLIARARAEVASGTTKPLDEVLDNK